MKITCLAHHADHEKKKAKKTEADYDTEWREKYGDEAAAVIRKTVDDNMPAYLYLKQFAIKIRAPTSPILN